jgi:hypothetical protein
MDSNGVRVQVRVPSFAVRPVPSKNETVTHTFLTWVVVGVEARGRAHFLVAVPANIALGRIEFLGGFGLLFAWTKHFSSIVMITIVVESSGSRISSSRRSSFHELINLCGLFRSLKSRISVQLSKRIIAVSLKLFTRFTKTI